MPFVLRNYENVQAKESAVVVGGSNTVMQTFGTCDCCHRPLTMLTKAWFHRTGCLHDRCLACFQALGENTMSEFICDVCKLPTNGKSHCVFSYETGPKSLCTSCFERVLAAEKAAEPTVSGDVPTPASDEASTKVVTMYSCTACHKPINPLELSAFTPKSGEYRRFPLCPACCNRLIKEDQTKTCFERVHSQQATENAVFEKWEPASQWANFGTTERGTITFRIKLTEMADLLMANGYTVTKNAE